MKPTHCTMDHLTKTIRIMKMNNSGDTYEVVGEKLTCCSTELFIFFAGHVQQHVGDKQFQDEVAAHPIQDAPKTGHSQKPNSWRPIALLDVAYKVSAEIVHKRTRIILDAKLSLYQVGFKRGLGLEFATLVFEYVGYWNIWNGAVKFGWQTWTSRKHLVE